MVNAAGNVATSAVSVLTLSDTDNLPGGDRFVAVGNLNAEFPFAFWATAAGGIQAAVNAADPGDVIRIARGTYQGTCQTAETVDVSITHSLSLIGVHPREQVILDGGSCALGSRPPRRHRCQSPCSRARGSAPPMCGSRG